MMKVPSVTTLAIVSIAAALNGCVSYGNTHALVTPVGVVGVHSFKPSDSAREIRIPAQKNPDRVAAAQAQQEAQQDAQQNDI